MASSVKQLCTICNDDGISNSAVTWCTECEVLFCGDCEKPHSKSHLSKNHKTMSADDYQKLPTFMQEISSQCQDHKKKFELYCSCHACPCCVQCVTDKHKMCQEMKPLSDILQQVKSSASVQLFETDLKDVKENIDTAIKYLQTRITTTDTQNTKAIEKIRYMRKSIDDYLNKLEQDLRNDLESKHSQLKSNMASLMQQMEQRACQINQIQSQFSETTRYTTELQRFIALREIEKITSQTTKYIEDLESGDHFIEKNLEVNLSSALQSILQDVKSFGDININTTTSTLKIKAGRKDQAQHLIPKVPGVEQIKPSLLTKLTIPKDMKSLNITVCLILPDGNFIILDNINKQLLLFSNDGIFIRKVVSFTEFPYDDCLVMNNTVAVALGQGNQTVLVDVNRSKIVQSIKLSHNCFGVASDCKTLVISDSDSQCTTVNLSDMSHTILEGMRGVFRISLFQGNIYGTKYSENKVYCYKVTGEPLWTFQHQDIARPRGLTLDKNGFVYIASYGNNSILVVSPDGKICKTILSDADGIKGPHAIDINRETGLMIVSSHTSGEKNEKSYQTCFVYKV
ncbi:tripartite motif-containing protein 2-like [Mytilus edulis]|uniref:tripartite motif-containing protein 2-like n=1 Tax=Mytilus edulis TaxID=6550 RepID=UPI0039EDF209